MTTPHVFAAGTVGWSDNLLRADDDAPGVRKRREGFGRAEAGMRLDTRLGDHRLELDGRAGATEYFDSGRYDLAEGGVKARFDLDWNEVDLHGDVGWRRYAYPQSLQLVGIVRLDVYSAASWLQAEVGRFGVRTGGYLQVIDYRERELRNLDHLEYGADIQLYGRITPKLRGLVEYNFQEVTWRRGRAGTLNDFRTHQVRGGVDGELTEKVTASLKVGATFQDVRRRVNPDRREFAGLTLGCSVSWRPLVNTSLSAGWDRSITPSINSNYLLTDAFSVGITQRVWEQRISLGANAGYSHARVSPGRHLNAIRAGASAAWNITQWLSVRAGYQFEHLTSAFTLAESAVSDYAVHEVSMSVGVGF